MKISKKICLVGDETVGKTSISNRFSDNSFSESYKATIGVKLFQKTLNVNSRDISLIVWDIQGGKEIISSPQQYYRSAHGLFFVCDISNEASISNLDFYIDIVKTKYHSAKKFLLINKIDLKDYLHNIEIIEKKYSNLFSGIFKTSAKEGIGVQEAFIKMAESFIE